MTEQTEASPAPGDSPLAAQTAHPGPDRDGRDLVVIVPVLARPDRIAPLMRSLREAGPERCRVVFVATVGCPALAGVEAWLADTLRTFVVEVMTLPANVRGDYAIKVNHAYRHTTEPFMLLAADDVHFHPGWWPAARRLFDDPAVGVVGTNDLGSARVIAGEHATHPVVRRAYIDQFGTIDEAGKVLHERYWHEFVDDELVATAKYRGAYAHATDSIVEHLHPSWGKARMDPLYAQQARRMNHGRRIFARRRHLWTR